MVLCPALKKLTVDISTVVTPFPRWWQFHLIWSGERIYNAPYIVSMHKHHLTALIVLSTNFKLYYTGVNKVPSNFNIKQELCAKEWALKIGWILKNVASQKSLISSSVLQWEVDTSFLIVGLFSIICCFNTKLSCYNIFVLTRIYLKENLICEYFHAQIFYCIPTIASQYLYGALAVLVGYSIIKPKSIFRATKSASNKLQQNFVVFVFNRFFSNNWLTAWLLAWCLQSTSTVCISLCVSSPVSVVNSSSSTYGFFTADCVCGVMVVVVVSVCVLACMHVCVGGEG